MHGLPLSQHKRGVADTGGGGGGWGMTLGEVLSWVWWTAQWAHVKERMGIEHLFKAGLFSYSIKARLFQRKKSPLVFSKLNSFTVRPM